MKVIFPLNFYYPLIGGAEISAHNLANQLISKYSWKIFVVTNSWKKFKKNEKIDRVQIVRFNPISVNKKSIGYFLNIIPFIYSITKIVKKERIHVLHTHSHIFALFSSVIVGKIQKKPVIHTVAGSDVFIHPKNPIYRAIMTFLFNRSNIIIAKSRSLLNQTQKFVKDSQKVFLISNAINFPKESKSKNEKDGSLDIYFIGRLEEVKGVYILIEAFQKAYFYSQNKLKLYFIGDGSERKNLEHVVSEKELENGVSFLGWRKNPIKYLYGSNRILVLPSFSEGFPNILLEAAAAQCPIIASSVGGMKEMVVNMNNGILIPPKNVELLFKAIIFYVENPQKREEFAAASFIYNKTKFNWNVVLPKYFEVYSHLLSQ
ncbi:MAG: glycosyltransferase family 4 protein [Promethearchaeota archaeon]